ncbi:MAG: ABC transporter transmembrane domain-containing protein, partial [bacterium]
MKRYFYRVNDTYELAAVEIFERMGFFKDIVEIRRLAKERQRETKGKEKTISLAELAKVYKKFGPFFKKYWKIFLLAYSSLLVTIGLGLLKPWPLKLILDHLVLKEPFPEQVSFLMPYYESDPKFLLLILALSVVGIAVVSAVFSYFTNFWLSSTGFYLNADIREHVFAHLQKLSLSFHDKSQSGNLLYILTNDFKVVKGLLIQFPQALIERTVTFVAYLVIMLMMDWRLALIGFCTMPFIYFATKFFGSGVKVATHKMRRRLGEISTILLENVSSMAVIQAYGREKDEWQRFREGNE